MACGSSKAKKRVIIMVKLRPMEKKMWDAVDHHARVILKNGQVFEDDVTDITSDLDNTPPETSIDLGHGSVIEIYEHQIKDIIILD